jgi:hypothetical protein
MNDLLLALAMNVAWIVLVLFIDQNWGHRDDQ